MKRWFLFLGLLVMLAGRANAAIIDPISGLTWGLKAGTVLEGYFTDVSGLGNEHEVVEHRIITETGATVVRKIPGASKTYDITFKRGMTADRAAWEWRQLVIDGKIEEARVREAALTLYDATMRPVGEWVLINAWPKSVTVSRDQTTVIETIVLTVEDMRRIR